jgi:iron complex outermembrane receptor protein
MNFKIKPRHAAVLLACASAGALAQTAPQAATPQTIEITGRAERNPFAETSFSVTGTQADVLDIPQSVSAVTKEVIREQGLLRLNDVAPFIAGVNEFSVYDDLTIRGFRNFDDRRVNGLRTYNNFWKQPFVAHLERVEVIKGPASAMFGDASPGGTVNLVTKKPLSQTRREVELRLGSHKERYAAIDLTGPLSKDGRLLYRLNAAVEDSDSFRNQSFHKGWLLAPSLTWLATPDTRVNLDIVLSDDRSVLDRGQPNIDGAGQLGLVPPEVMVTQPGDRLDTVDRSLALNLEHRLSERWTLSAALMRYRYREELQEHGLNYYITPSVIDLYATDRDTRADTSNAAVRAVGRFETGAVAHELVIGADAAQREDFQADGYTDSDTVGTFDLLNPVYQPRDFSSYTYITGEYGGELKTQAVFAHDTLTLGPWQLLLGLRHQRYETTPLGAGKQTSSITLPRVGVIRKFGDDRSVYATYVEGFQPPDTYANAPGRGGPFKPEDSRLIEVGFKQRAFDGRFLFTASAYEIVKNNVITYVGFFNGEDQYRQRGQERGRGVEFEANGRLTQQLTVLANLAYNDARIVRDEDPALVNAVKEGAPRLAAKLFARYDLGQGLGVGAGVTHVSARETFERPLQLPAYTVGNLALYWKRGDLSLQLKVDNVTDEVHWTGGYNYGRVFPGAPRSLRASAAWRF